MAGPAPRALSVLKQGGIRGPFDALAWPGAVPAVVRLAATGPVAVGSAAVGSAAVGSAAVGSTAVASTAVATGSTQQSISAGAAPPRLNKNFALKIKRSQ